MQAPGIVRRRRESVRNRLNPETVPDARAPARFLTPPPSDTGTNTVRQQGSYWKRGASAKEKMTTSSPVTVLMSWCMLNTFTPATSWTSDSNIGRANSSSCFRTCLMRSLPFFAGHGTDVMVHAQHLHASDLVDQRFQHRAGHL